MIYSIFADSLEKILIGFIQDDLNTNSLEAAVVPGASEAITVLPRVVVNGVSEVEAIFESGIYDLVVEFTAKTNFADNGTPETAETDTGAALFGVLVDLVNHSDLKTRINDVGTVMVKGIVLGDQRLGEVGDQYWSKTVSVQFFGYATPS